jgi:hypothetical protein
MDKDPKPRRETKKTAKEKAQGKTTIYSAKHVRQLESLREKSKSK